MITTELFALGLVVKLLLEFFSKREERASIPKTFTLPTPFEEDVVNFLVKFMRPSCSRAGASEFRISCFGIIQLSAHFSAG